MASLMLSVYVSHDVSIVEHHDGGSFPTFMVHTLRNDAVVRNTFSIRIFVAQIHHKLKGLFRNADGQF